MPRPCYRSTQWNAVPQAGRQTDSINVPWMRINRWVGYTLELDRMSHKAGFETSIKCSHLMQWIRVSRQQTNKQKMHFLKLFIWRVWCWADGNWNRLYRFACKGLHHITAKPHTTYNSAHYKHVLHTRILCRVVGRRCSTSSNCWPAVTMHFMHFILRLSAPK